MDSNSVVIKYLVKMGYNPQTAYYSKINNWDNWYCNYVDKFHTYYDQNYEKREIYKLGMAKRVCEDWSSILYTERDNIICKNNNNQTYLDTKIKDLKFNYVIPDNIETSFWSGTVGTITRIKNAVVKDNKIVASSNTYYDLVNVSAKQIIPLLVEDGKIINVAFVSETTIENKKAYYIEIHELKDEGYIVKNIYIDEQGDEKVNKAVAKQYSTGSRVQLFNLLEPRIANNIKESNGLGISIYGNAIDQLKACDVTYNNFMSDFYLGGKKVFYNKKLVNYSTVNITDSKTGETVAKEVPIYPDDLTRQQFQLIGSEMDNLDEKALVHEYNPDLRVEDNEKGINFALNLLAFKCGLGKGYYRFENGTVVTATQYLGENKDLVGNAKKHRSAVNDYVVGIARSILLLGRILFGESVDENDEITLTDKDGFLISDEELALQYKEDLKAGLISKVTYLMKARGMSEDQAKKELEKAKADNPDIKSLLGTNM